MKFMLIVKASEKSEAGVMPTPAEFAKMGAFNEELVKAGVLLDADGLHPSSKGVRIMYDDDKTTVVDGPFTETKELISGFWLLQVRSKAEAVEWARRAPNPSGSGKTNIEVRQVFTAEDFGDAMPEEQKAAEQRMREEVKRQHPDAP